MTLKSYIWGIRILTLISVAAFILALVYINPDMAGTAGKVIIFTILFFVLSGFFNLVLLRLRRGMTDGENAHNNVSLSFRQGILISIFAVGMLVLRGLDMLTWWDGLLLLAGVFLIELYFLSRD